MSEKKDVLFIHALTGLHPGSGAALGVVDLPVQRERHTAWPVIPASTIKGVLRDACREAVRKDHDHDRRLANETDHRLVSAFGPAQIRMGDDAHAGAVSFTDARILAFPVRSIRGVFAWVTCPSVLERLKRDCAIAELDPTRLMWPVPKEGQAFFTGAVGVDNRLVLEELDFEGASDPGNRREVLVEWLAPRVSRDKATQDRLRTHLVVLSDDEFTHFVRHATEVTARIGLDYERKTVKAGALFYQEFLPAETLFYSLLMVGDGRRAGDRLNAASLHKFVSDCLPPVLQIGADETIGKGLCSVRLAGADGGH